MSFVTQNKTEIKEIIREESILSSLESPYVIKYYESFLNNETICIVTELCEVSLNLSSKKNRFRFPNWIGIVIEGRRFESENQEP